MDDRESAERRVPVGEGGGWQQLPLCAPAATGRVAIWARSSRLRRCPAGWGRDRLSVGGISDGAFRGAIAVFSTSARRRAKIAVKIGPKKRCEEKVVSAEFIKV